MLSYGADLCGFANIDRFDNAPPGYNPTDIYHDCKSVISFAVAMPQGLAKINPRLIYGHHNYISYPETDIIAFKPAKRIEQLFNCNAILIPCDSLYEYWDSDKMEEIGLLSMKHIAVRSGLGSFRKNTLLLTQSYGNMVTL